MPIKLVYWNVRGLGEPVRLLLKYQGADWEEDTLILGPEGFAKWQAMKDDEDLPFGNVPLIEDDGKKVTQSITVMRYLGRKLNLFPKSDDDLLKAEIIEQEIYDLRNKMTSVCYNPFMAMGPFPGSDVGKFDHEFLKNKFVGRVKERLPKFEKILTKSFILGDEISYVDFLVCEYLDQLRDFVPEVFQEFSNINNYLKRFHEHPNLKPHYESEEYKSMTINAPFAEWSKKE